MRKIAILLLSIFILNITYSQSSLNAPKYSNEFLNIGVGARALGMSNSIINSSDDVYSGYWNPTGLCSINSDMQIGIMHSEYFAGIAKYDFAGIAKRIDSTSAFSFSFIRFGVDNIPNTTELIDAQGNINYDRISYFSATDMAFLLSYAKQINSKLSLGASAKIINRKVGSFANAWGFGLDLACSYESNNWKFAAVARDVTSTFNAWNFQLSDEMIETFLLTGNELPQNGLELTLPRIILGVSKLIKVDDDFSLITELNTDITTDGMRNVLISSSPFSIDPHIGMELNFRKIIYLRAGLGNVQTITEFSGKEVINVQPNLGLGIRIKGISLDYALADIGDVSVALYSNVFSLRFNLNPENKKK